MERLSEVLAEVTRTMFEVEALDEVLQVIVDNAARATGVSEDAGVLFLMRDRQIDAPATTSDVVARVEKAEIELDDGPCLKALREHAMVESEDLSREERWPEWSRVAVDAGFHSMAGFRLYAGEDSLGVLNLFSSRPRAFDDDARAAGLALAAHGAIAVANSMVFATHADTVQGLGNALASRDVIGQAKGILMERHHITADEAFAQLRATSQARNRKLREIAEEVADTGTLADT